MCGGLLPNPNPKWLCSDITASIVVLRGSASFAALSKNGRTRPDKPNIFPRYQLCAGGISPVEFVVLNCVFSSPKGACVCVCGWCVF